LDAVVDLGLVLYDIGVLIAIDPQASDQGPGIEVPPP